MIAVPKVGAFITRAGKESRRELLLFTHLDHPDAPIQIPGGSVEPGEAIEVALQREIEEETGLTGLAIERKLGVSQVPSIVDPSQILERHCYVLIAPSHCPDTWIHSVRGNGLDQNLRFEFRWHSIDPTFTLTGDLGFFLKPEHLPELYSMK